MITLDANTVWVYGWHAEILGANISFTLAREAVEQRSGEKLEWKGSNSHGEVHRYGVYWVQPVTVSDKPEPAPERDPVRALGKALANTLGEIAIGQVVEFTVTPVIYEAVSKVRRVLAGSR